MMNNAALLNAVAALDIPVESQNSEPAKKSSATSATSAKSIPQGDWTDEKLEAALMAASVTVYGTERELYEGQSHVKYFVPCPNEAQHTTQTKRKDSAVWVYNGWPVFHCVHGHCSGWKFADYAQAVGIQYRKQTGRVPDNETHYYSHFYQWKVDQAGNEVAKSVIDAAVVEWICESYDFFVMGDMPYFLNEYNCYQMDKGGAKMKRLIQSCIMTHLRKDSTIMGIYRMILYQDKRKEYDELNQYPDYWVPFRNGFYDPVMDSMYPITPEHYVINQIPHEYDPDAVIESPVIDDLLQYQLPDPDARELWLEYCGSCFNRDTSGQKWMIIRGRGGTGKSVQLNLLIACLGEENVSHETLQGLTERFNATQLFGKLANVCADISSEDMERTDILKKITGQDRNGIKYEQKGKDAFFFTPFCKLIFSANEIPMNRDEKSDAFYRRLLITVIDRKPARTDRMLQRKLDAEIDGVIHRYMEALQRYYQRGEYPASEISDREVNILRRNADSVIAFIEDELEWDPYGRISRADVYNRYMEYCDDEDRIYPVTKRTLFNRFRAEGIQEVRSHSNIRYFSGVKWREPYENI